MAATDEDNAELWAMELNAQKAENKERKLNKKLECLCAAIQRLEDAKERLLHEVTLAKRERIDADDQVEQKKFDIEIKTYLWLEPKKMPRKRKADDDWKKQVT